MSASIQAYCQLLKPFEHHYSCTLSKGKSSKRKVEWFTSKSASENAGHSSPQPALFLLEQVIFLFSMFSMAVLWCPVVSAFPILNDTLSFLSKLKQNSCSSFSEMSLESLRTSQSFMFWSVLSSFLFSRLATYKTNSMITAHIRGSWKKFSKAKVSA